MKCFSKVAFGALIAAISLFSYDQSQAQYLKAEGKKIVDDNGNEVILRGIGLGGWMLQEGYMLRTSGPQYRIESRIEALVGKEKKEQFYDAWLSNHTQKIDIDSMASWGYNSVRLPMHYNLFTPPIEEEPVPGEITWIEKGFEMTDQLLDWCEANQIYLLLDLHAAPGGQGENADINDYDPTKPSLWDSELNQQKMIALWKKLAERYKDEPWLGAYDIINEPNWGFQNHANDLNGCSENQNTPLWNLQKEITKAIREVDQTHIIIIEGNCWGNNYSGLPALWDNNLVISYHKYWNGNEQSNIQGMLDMRNNRNVPIWLGETGENSNSWFTDCVDLLETNGIGWSWWPLKKLGGNNPLQIPMSDGYQKVIDYWNGGSKPGATEAFDGLMEFAENTKLENNIYKPDVVDALIRQPHTDETRPFKAHVLKAGAQTIIQAADYDFGRQGFAYSDADYTNTSGGAGGGQWNKGGGYRNDGVDIEATGDTSESSDGYNVGWTEDDEWMQYTVQVDSSAGYKFSIRYAGQSASKIHLEVDGLNATGSIELPGTGGYQTWATKEIENVIVEKGTRKLKVYIEKGGANLGYFGFFLTAKLSEIEFQAVAGETDEEGTSIYLTFNKDIKSEFTADLADISISVGDLEFHPTAVEALSGRQLQLTIDAELTDEDAISISYAGDWLASADGSALAEFTNLAVVNNLPVHIKVPAKIEAEDFIFNRGLVVEETTDSGGGFNVGYTDNGDYIEYRIAVDVTGTYTVEARTAAQSNAGKLGFEQRTTSGEILNTAQLDVPVTGGWQTWKTITGTMKLTSDRGILRVKVVSSGFNLNWFRISGNPNGIGKIAEWTVYPNPTSDTLTIDLEPGDYSTENELRIMDLTGKELARKSNLSEASYRKLDISSLPSGNFIIRVTFENSDRTIRIVKN